MKSACLTLIATSTLALTGTASGQVQLVPLPEGFAGTKINGDGTVVTGGITAGYLGAPLGAIGRWTRTGGLAQLAPYAYDALTNEHTGAAVGIDESGDQVLVSLPSIPGNYGLWSAATGITALPSFPSAGSSFATLISGDGATIIGFQGSNGVQAALRWAGVAAPTELCGPGCNFLPYAVSHTGNELVGRGGAGMAPGRYFWSATAGFSFIGPSVPLSDLSQMDISSDGGTVVFVEAVNSLALWRPATGQVSIGAPPNALWVKFPKIDATGDRVFASVEVVGQGGGLVSRDWMWTPTLGWVDFQEHLVQLGATGLTSGSTLVNPNVTLVDLAPGGNAALAWVHYPGTTSWRSTVIYFDAPTPGAIGAGFCAPQYVGASLTSTTLTASGSEAVANNDVTLTAANLPSGVFGYFLNARGQGSVANPGGALGTLCLGGASGLGRHNRVGEVLQSGASGTFSLALDLNDLPTPLGSTAAQAGETWNFQGWHRDGNQSNFTPAVSVTFQ